ncbi:hypothetical protein [Cognatilysobacter bugurensis]|uniref:Cell surface protein n=1 Tax=Cognatilysobacter bugurensis TaxID=543356 RepID=A0A918T666_9GAMM|nr:hypothetical protein [Lysobacter bugurensis]GHA87120.1 hypothetical protein GCM10007067_26210 [Lysobacter bugurensis]
MQLKTKLVVALVASMFATSAFAEGDDVANDVAWDQINSMWTIGDVFVSGDIAVGSQSSATVDQDQTTALNFVLGDGDMSASAEDSALSGAMGNIGANIAAGAGNAQANDAALSTIDGESVFSSASVFSSQASGVNIASDFPSGADNQLSYDASVGDDVLADAMGNIGLNVAAGVGNAQTNAMAASVNTSGTVANASADSEQTSLANFVAVLEDLDASATLDGGALANAIGNIGVNIAAGSGNLQHNGLALATGTGN